MSIKISHNSEVLEIIDRIKSLLSLKRDFEVADLFGIKSNDLSNRKKRGTVKKIAIDWAVRENINLDWLLTGQGSPKKVGNHIVEGQATYKPLKNPQILKKTLKAVENVFDSEGIILEPEDKAEAISLLYEIYSDTGKQPDNEIIKRYLRLVVSK